MTLAILILVIILIFWVGCLMVMVFSVNEATEKALKEYIDNEHLRLLTAIYNKERNMELMREGEEVEI